MSKRDTWTQDDLQRFTHTLNCMGVRFGAMADMRAIERKFSPAAISEMGAAYRKGPSACGCPLCREDQRTTPNPTEGDTARRELTRH